MVEILGRKHKSAPQSCITLILLQMVFCFVFILFKCDVQAAHPSQYLV